LKLLDMIDMPNIAEELDEEELGKIGSRVFEEYEIDETSREPWLRRNEEAMKIAMQVEEIKNTPWKNAANVKYPLLTIACIQFSSRALPNIIKDGQVVKAKVTGLDPRGEKRARGNRISSYMSYQFMEEMPEWVEDNDKLFTSLPIVGCMFKKIYRDTMHNRNVSERVFPANLVMHYNTPSMERAVRKTHIIELTPNEIEERVRGDLFIDHDYMKAGGTDRSNDDDAPHTFLEQHRLWDLDSDGYKEPYIVTFHKDTKQVARIVARFDEDGIKETGTKKKKIWSIKPVEYFVKFPFIPSPDGSIYDIGYGALEGPINKTVNQTINQLLDAGTLNNTQGGFLGRGVNLGRGRGGGNVNFKPNEWKKVNFTGDDIRKSIFQLPTKEPSTVLFQLLGLMIDAGDKISSVADVLTGESPGAEAPATTTLALIEQGLKVFNGIYLRIHKGLKAEYKAHARLNKIYLPQYSYYIVGDNPKGIVRKDFDDRDCDVQPISNPNEATQTQQLIKAEALMSKLGMGYNDQEIKSRYLDAMDVPDKEAILKAPPAPPDPKMVIEQKKLELEGQKLQLDMFKEKYKMVESRTKCMLNIAKAEAAEAGPQLEQYKAELASIDKFIASQGGGSGNNKG